MSLLALVATDWLALAACLSLTWVFRQTVARELFPSLGPLYPLSGYFRDLYFFAPWIVVFGASRLYSQRTHAWEEARAMIKATTVGTVLAVALTFAEKTAGGMSRTLIVGVWMLTLVLVPLCRFGSKILLARLGLWQKRVLIVGSGEPALRVCRSMGADPVLGYQAVGFVDAAPSESGSQLDGIALFGPFEELPRIISETAVRDVVIAMPDAGRERIAELVSLCEGHVENVRLMPDTLGLASLGVDTEHVGGHLLLRMRWNLAKPWNTAAKRSFDLLMSSLGLLALSPLLLLLAIAVFLDSGLPVFFVQQRVGRGGRIFPCYKFRSMFVDGEQRLAALFAQDPSAREEWERFAKLKRRDPRVTRVGRLMRRFSLDDLPQLLNVFLGHMSLVGPRPYLPAELEGNEAVFQTILKTWPGITGLWQVSGRNRLTMRQRQQLDEYYVRNWSIWSDVVILLQTVGVVLRGDGAY